MAEGCCDNGRQSSFPSSSTSLGRRDSNGISKYPTIRRFTMTSPVRVEILRRLHSANGLLESRLFPRTAMDVARTRESLAMCDTSERASRCCGTRAETKADCSCATTRSTFHKRFLRQPGQANMYPGLRKTSETVPGPNDYNSQ